MPARDLMKNNWKLISSILTPIVLLPIWLVPGTDPAKCAYVICLMGVFWVFEFVPLSVTALLPAGLFPLLGILGSGETAAKYCTNTIMLLLGSFMMAIALEKCNLHRRLALATLRLMGTSTPLVMLAVMLPTWFLSMWMSNTATTAMMIPIVESTLEVLTAKGGSAEQDKEAESDQEKNGDVESPRKKRPESEAAESVDTNANDSDSELELRPMIALCLAYAANIGGTASLIGTPPNLLLADALDEYDGQPINFLTWMGLALPQSLLCLFIAWIYLQVYFLGITSFWRRKQDDGDARRREALKRMVREKYEELGSFSYAEVNVLAAFAVLIALWFFRSPGFIQGWGDLLVTENLYGMEVDTADATPVVLMAILMFLLPAEPIGRSEGGETRKLLDWESVHEKCPWGVLLVLGGGFALAEGSEKSCLNAWIGSLFEGLALDPILICFLATVVMVSVTQVVSNSATTAMLLPVLEQLALDLKLNPLLLMVPPVVAVSYAFLLPVSTGVNTIVYTVSGLTTAQFARAGIGMNILSLGVVMLATVTQWDAMFDLKGEQPDWAAGGGGAAENATDFCVGVI